jgi:hypothetical protein
MIDYKIAIPTHRRADIIGDMAFYWLKEWNVDFDKVYLFVSDDEDYNEYTKKYPNIKIIKSDTDNIGAKRNFIRNYFNDDEYIISMDDSFCGMKILIGDGPKLETFMNFEELVKQSYEQMIFHKTKIFGINSIENSLWMRNKADTKNGCITGKFYGFINDRSEDLIVHNPIGEDAELAVRHYRKFGAIVRWLNICFDKPKYGGVKGGLQAIWTQEKRAKLNAKANRWTVENFDIFCELKDVKDEHKVNWGLKYLSPTAMEIKIWEKDRLKNRDINEIKNKINNMDENRMVEVVDIDLVKLNKDNPRKIKKDKMATLVKSILDFPQMLNIRPIVVDENMVVLGGNMRLQACKKAGLTEVPIIKFKDLTKEQKQEFIVKDNVGYGEWDWEILENNDNWDLEKLNEWGLDWAGPKSQEDEEPGEIQFNKGLDFDSNYIVLKFDKDIDWIQAQSMFGLESGWNKGGSGKAYTKGIGRVIDGVDAILKIKELGNEG